MTVLNKQFLLETKFLSHTKSSFITKELGKGIMKRSELKNKYNKDRKHKTWSLHNRQRNFCVTVVRKTKKNYFKHVKMEDMRNNKEF